LAEDKEYCLFVSTHYEFKEEVSLVPEWSGDRPIFPTRTVIVKKQLSLFQKLKYYFNDFKLWIRERWFS